MSEPLITLIFVMGYDGVSGLVSELGCWGFRLGFLGFCVGCLVVLRWWDVWMVWLAGSVRESPLRVGRLAAFTGVCCFDF